LTPASAAAWSCAESPPLTPSAPTSTPSISRGELELSVADEHYHLAEGDTITYASRLPHRNKNRGSTSARVLFCLTPPSF
jgi:quercetin dioxygenase-like cupin family protein